MRAWCGPAVTVRGRYQAITPGSYGELIALVARVRGETANR